MVIRAAAIVVEQEPVVVVERVEDVAAPEGEAVLAIVAEFVPGPGIGHEIAAVLRLIVQAEIAFRGVAPVGADAEQGAIPHAPLLAQPDVGGEARRIEQLVAFPVVLAGIGDLGAQEA